MELIIVLLAIILLQFYFLSKNKNVNKLLIFFMLISFILWYVIPIILTLSNITVVLEFLRIDIEEFQNLVIKELIFLSIILLFFNIFQIGRKIKLSRLELSDNSPKYFMNKIFYIFSIIFAIIYIVYILQNKMDYKENNDVNNQEGGLFQILTFFSTLFFSYFWVLIIFGEKNIRRVISIYIIIIYSIVLVLSGSRIYMLNIIFLLYFIYSGQENKFRRVRTIFLAIGLIFSSMILLPILSSKRVGQDSPTINSVSQTIVLEELNIKLNNFAYSSILLKYDGEGFAGFNPYIGSMLKFIPRFIWQNKPTATSYNSEINGIPARRVPNLLGDYSDSFNVGVSAYAVSAWQMGTFTVILSIVINILFLLFLNFSLNSTSIYMKSLAIMLIGIPQLVMTPTYGDNIIQFMVQAFLFYLVFIFLKLIKFKVR